MHACSHRQGLQHSVSQYNFMQEVKTCCRDPECMHAATCETDSTPKQAQHCCSISDDDLMLRVTPYSLLLSARHCNNQM